jgi:hypothetical protein
MRKIALGNVVCALVLFTAVSARAEFELPAPSPGAKVSQRVGLTDISVDYSSPGVKGRKIWGELVPNDKVWRTGANAATKITFSRDVTIGGKPVPAGTYGVVTIPTASTWTVMLSKDTHVLEGGKAYDEKEEAARATVTPTAIPQRERLVFVFGNTTDEGTSLDLEWEKLRVSLPITVDTTKQVMANVKDLENAWRNHAFAARYLAETSKDYDAALKLVDTSLGIQVAWLNSWIKADILAKKGKYAEARKHAQTAWDLGQKNPDSFFFKDQVSKALTEWKGKK